MLSEDWIPTPLIPQEERQKVEIVEPEPEPRFASLRVLSRFIRFLSIRWWLRLIGRYDKDASAVRLRGVFEDSGGLWIKLGQLLSLRTDIFSAAICRELSKLQYQAQGFPSRFVYQTLHAELGEDLGLIFESFQEAPIAAASISQVHLAVLRDPHLQVAVKICRPDAEVSFMRDLRNIGRLIRILESFSVAPHIRWSDAYWELEQMVQEELDFRYEASNTQRMRKVLKNHGVYAPRVFFDYSTRRVLVTEYIHGVLMSDFIQMGQNDPGRLIQWCRENSVNPRKVGRRLFLTAMRQLFEDNLFHADLHPGNILLLRDSRFALIDFGTIGQSEKGFLNKYLASLRALAVHDYAKAADYTLGLAINPPAISQMQPLRTELIRSYRYWEARTHLRGLNYHERSLASAGSDSGRIMFKYQVQLTWAFMRISRTWATLDASLSFLMPKANHMQLFQIYFREAGQRRHRLRDVIPKTVQAIQQFSTTVEEYNNILGPMLRWQGLNLLALASKSERLALFGASIFRMLRTLSILATLFALYIFLRLHHSDILIIDHPFLNDFAMGFKGLFHQGDWIIILFFAVVLIAYLSKIIRGLLKP
ncbi:MAG: ABC1 kinase family protein [Candidatus Competibacteraceae bacterium]